MSKYLRQYRLELSVSNKRIEIKRVTYYLCIMPLTFLHGKLINFEKILEKKYNNMSIPTVHFNESLKLFIAVKIAKQFKSL